MRSFAPLNLHWNPFGELPPKERGRLTVPGFDVEAITRRLATPGFALELLGPCGRGKSSHLWALHDRFRDQPVTYVEPGERPTIPKASVVFVDESQRVSPRARRRLFRRRASFVLATHESHADELRAAGLEVRTHAVRDGSASHVRAFVSARLEWARRGPGPLPEVPDVMLAELRERHGDDLRAIGDALYDFFQRERDRAHAEV